MELNRPPQPSDPMFPQWLYEMWLAAKEIANNSQPLDGDLTAIAALSGTGYAKRTGANTWTLDAGGGGGGNTVYNTIDVPTTVAADVEVPYMDDLYVKSDFTVNGTVYVWRNSDVLMPPQAGKAGMFLTTDGTTTSWSSPGGGGTVLSVSVTTANGFSGSVATATSTPAISIGTTVTGLLKGDGTSVSSASAGTDYIAPYGSTTANYFLAAPNGSAGAPTFRAIVAADIPTLNQNTTGNAATATALQTARTINGVSFNGSANITVTADATTLTNGSGTYTPTLTNVTNISSSTSASAQWLRVGNTVTVSGRINVTQTVSNTASQVDISLPVSSDLTATEHLAGAGAAVTGGTPFPAQILGDATNNRASVKFNLPVTTATDMSYTFTYRVA